MFPVEISFDLLVRRQIARLEQPGLECVKLAYDEMERMVSVHGCVCVCVCVYVCQCVCKCMCMCVYVCVCT